MPYRIEPIFKAKPWGGNRLSTMYGFTTDQENIGECWGISGYKGSETRLAEGPYEEFSLHELWTQHPELFGHHPSKDFPILIKLIDAQDDLSIQVHPDDDYAKIHEHSLGKSECWYILDCKPESDIIIGHQADTMDTFKAYVEEGRFLELVNHYPIQPHDAFRINPGTIHAIKKDTQLLEIQQSSDVTYRFYDYDRIYDGKKRPLHLKQAMDVINIPDNKVIHDLSTPYFTTDIHTTPNILPPHQHGRYLFISQGSLTINGTPYQAGTFLFSPCDETLHIEGKDFELVDVTIN